MSNNEVQSSGSDESVKKYLGVDFGTKRIGVAVSDDSASMAFPKNVLPNEGWVPDEILTMCRSLGIEDVVLGESKNFKGEDNTVMEDARQFAEQLRTRGLHVIFEPEIMSTIQAERLQGQRPDIDASAAAVILQSYLDRMRKQRNPQKSLEEIEDSKYRLDQ